MADEWVRIELADWQAQGVKLFGEDINKWQYVCPSCGHVQTRADWIALGMDPRRIDTLVGFTCIGRWLNPLEAVPTFNDSRGYGCIYVGSLQPNISPITLIVSPGEERPTFGWATS